jgi:hypothetical protein
MRSCGDSKIAAETAAALFERFLLAEAGDNFLLRMCSSLRRKRLCLMASAEARFAGRLSAVLEIREQACPAHTGVVPVAHEPLVDIARGLLASTHGV